MQEAFAAFPSLGEIDVPLPVASPKKFGYRSRVKLAVQSVEGQILIGLYVPETHRVFDISACPVHPKEVNRVVAFLKQAIERLHIIPMTKRAIPANSAISTCAIVFGSGRRCCCWSPAICTFPRYMT